MKIDWVKGTKHQKDRVYLVTTKEKEPITIFKLALLTNQLAINEVKIKEEWLDIDKEGLYFEKIVTGAIKHAKEGIDWAEPENEEKVKKLCEECYLPWAKIDHDLLRRTQQRKLSEYRRPTLKSRSLSVKTT